MAAVSTQSSFSPRVVPDEKIMDLPSSHPFASRSQVFNGEVPLESRSRTAGPPPPPRRTARRDQLTRDSDSDRSRDSLTLQPRRDRPEGSIPSRSGSPAIPVRAASRRIPPPGMDLTAGLDKPLPPILPLGPPISASNPSASTPQPARKDSVPFALLQSKLGILDEKHAVPTTGPASAGSQPDAYVGTLPSRAQLMQTATMFLRDENGDLVCFGDFFPRTPAERTVVFFIRHFWCGQCQDYMFASLSQLDPEALARENVRVVIISNGSWKIIKAYRKLFQCPFPVYVDGQRRLYSLMGMTKMTNDFGPNKGRAAYNQRSVPGQLAHGIGNALFRMPLANPGKLTQLGGEFVLGHNYTCSFAHRMTNTSNHMEAPDVLREAGVAQPTKQEHHDLRLEAAQLEEVARLQQQETEWRDAREAELERIQRKKAARRGDAQGLHVELEEAEVNDLAFEAERLQLQDPSEEDTAVSRASSQRGSRLGSPVKTP